MTYKCHASTYEWHKNDIRVHTDNIRVHTSDIWMTYKRHTSIYEWYTNDTRVHTIGIKYIKLYQGFGAFMLWFWTLFVVKTLLDFWLLGWSDYHTFYDNINNIIIISLTIGSENLNKLIGDPCYISWPDSALIFYLIRGR